MAELVLAAIAFVGSHFLLSSGPLRRRLVARLGEGPFLGTYSLLAGVLLVWMVSAYVRAPHVELWMQSAWARHLPLIVMPFALILVVGALRKDNPTSVTGNPADLPPGRLGLFAVTRHPLMWGVALWAAAHIPPNGDAASAIFFGAFLALALPGTLAIDAKKRRRRPQDFRRLAAVTSNLPFAAMLAGRARLSPKAVGWRPVALGLLLYGLLLTAHPWLFGASPLP